ncbi:hypothetical protein GQ53DRAFT_829814 [Thozetella sp. PMI_491]|nr:hypothetical protein GQ53DRAFT_829814 [Thozetella sp. PMI_491]
MRASVALTSSITGLCAAQGIIVPKDYDIYTDAVHDQWHNSSLVKYHASSVVERQQRLNFRVVSGILIVAGYTYTYGADQVGKTVDSCTEFQGGNTVTKGTCVKDALKLASSYAMVGVAGYIGPTATVGLLQSSLGLANTINGDQGQGPSVKRSAVDLPLFPYGSNHTSDSMIDMMNHALAVAKQQKLETQPVQRREQACSNRNADLFTGGHYWKFTDEYGMKIQCKNGCGDTDYDARDMSNVIDYMVTAIYTSNDLNAQFTLYDGSNGKVFSRCKLVLEDAVTDTCPESIEGSGCNF